MIELQLGYPNMHTHLHADTIDSLHGMKIPSHWHSNSFAFLKCGQAARTQKMYTQGKTIHFDLKYTRFRKNYRINLTKLHIFAPIAFCWWKLLLLFGSLYNGCFFIFSICFSRLNFHFCFFLTVLLLFTDPNCEQKWNESKIDVGRVGTLGYVKLFTFYGNNI